MIETTFTIICDFCKTTRFQGLPDVKAKETRQRANREAAWSLVDTGVGARDRCPACKGVNTGTRMH